MPSPQQILNGLSEISSRWQALAVFWHLYFAVFALVLLTGIRPPKRIAGILLGLPLLSVSFLAWLSGNNRSRQKLWTTTKGGP
jgi:type II secretory pathway component PulF